MTTVVTTRSNLSSEFKDLPAADIRPYHFLRRSNNPFPIALATYNRIDRLAFKDSDGRWWVLKDRRGFGIPTVRTRAARTP